MYSYDFCCLCLTQLSLEAFTYYFYLFFYFYFSFSGHNKTPFMVNSVFHFTVFHKGSIPVFLACFLM